MLGLWRLHFVLARGQETRTSPAKKKKWLRILRHNFALSDLFVSFHFWSNKFLSHCSLIHTMSGFLFKLVWIRTFRFFSIYFREFFWSFSFFVSIRHIDCARGLNFIPSNCYLLSPMCQCVCVWIEQPFSIRCKRKIIIFIVAFRSDKDTNRHNERMNLHPFERAVYMKILT